MGKISCLNVYKHRVCGSLLPTNRQRTERGAAARERAAAAAGPRPGLAGPRRAPALLEIAHPAPAVCPPAQRQAERRLRASRVHSALSPPAQCPDLLPAHQTAKSAGEKLSFVKHFYFSKQLKKRVCRPLPPPPDVLVHSSGPRGGHHVLSLPPSHWVWPLAPASRALPGQVCVWGGEMGGWGGGQSSMCECVFGECWIPVLRAPHP